MMHFRNTNLTDVIIAFFRFRRRAPSFDIAIAVHENRAGARCSLIWVNAACGRKRKNNSPRRGVEQRPLRVGRAARATGARTRVASLLSRQTDVRLLCVGSWH
jgi:hypothetical protein